MTRKDTTVSIARTRGLSDRDVESAFFTLLEPLGGLGSIIPDAARQVLIKPNLMTGQSWDTGITVHPLLIELLIGEVRALNKPVIVGEGAGWGCDSAEAFRLTGVGDLCRRLDVPLVDFKRGRSVDVPVPGGGAVHEVRVDETVPSCDFIISLAKMKTHCETLVSLSLKNMKGVISEDRERLRFHLCDVNRCLVDLNRVFTPHLAIVDGTVALQGIGPLLPGRPKPLGILVGGTDPVAVDSVCVRIMGRDPADIRHITLAHQAGLGTMDGRSIRIAGPAIDEVRPESWEFPPRSIEGLSPYEEIRVVNGNPCSNCIASIASYLHGYIDRRIVEKATHRVDVLIGGKARSKNRDNEIAIGNCLGRYRGKIPFVPGCPPPSDAYLELIERGLRGDFSPSTVDQDGRIVHLNEHEE